MGMLATVINSLALSSALDNEGCKNKVLTAIRMEPIGEFYSKAKAMEYLKSGHVTIISGGTGNPYFTTDTASSLRAIEIEADAMFKGTRVDGIYTADPEKDPTATKFDKITYDEIYNRGLKVMDLTDDNKNHARRLQYRGEGRPSHSFQFRKDFLDFRTRTAEPAGFFVFCFCCVCHCLPLCSREIRPLFSLVPSRGRLPSRLSIIWILCARCASCRTGSTFSK